MKAIVQDRYGSPDEVLHLREIDKPAVGPDEVLVLVRAASVHPDVWHVVTGRPYVLRLMGAGLLRPKNPVKISNTRSSKINTMSLNLPLKEVNIIIAFFFIVEWRFR